MIIDDGVRFCSRCRWDVTYDLTMDCKICGVYCLCLACSIHHNDVCVLRLREKTPIAAPPAAPSSSIFDAPLFWAFLIAIALAGAIALVTGI